MKILHLPHGYWPATGGAERLAEGWSRALIDRGHSVRVAVADLSTPEGLYCFGIAPTGRPSERHHGVDIQRLPVDLSYRLGGMLYRRDPYAAGRVADRLRSRVSVRLEEQLRREIKSFTPDVVLTMPHLFENVRSVLHLHEEMRFPLVWAPLLHESDPYWPFDEVREYVEHADALVAMTPSEANRLVDGYGADEDRVHVVPPGVVTPLLPPDTPDGPPTVLYLGRLSHTKGLDVLGRAMPIVWNENPETRFVVVGGSTPESGTIRAEMNALAARAHGSAEIRADISEDEKRELLQSATALVLPSVRESFGIVILEAWAAATPVVAVSSPPTQDTVRDGVDGVLVPNDDDAALAVALLDRLADPEGSRAMGRAGHERTLAEYSWERSGERLEAVYEAVLR